MKGGVKNYEGSKDIRLPRVKEVFRPISPYSSALKLKDKDEDKGKETDLDIPFSNLSLELSPTTTLAASRLLAPPELPELNFAALHQTHSSWPAQFSNRPKASPQSGSRQRVEESAITSRGGQNDQTISKISKKKQYVPNLYIDQTGLNTEEDSPLTRNRSKSDDLRASREDHIIKLTPEIFKRKENDRLSKYLDQGGDPDIFLGENNWPLLFWAVNDGSVDQFILLIKHGALVHQPSNEGLNLKDFVKSPRHHRFLREAKRRIENELIHIQSDLDKNLRTKEHALHEQLISEGLREILPAKKFKALRNRRPDNQIQENKLKEHIIALCSGKENPRDKSDQNRYFDNAAITHTLFGLLSQYSAKEIAEKIFDLTPYMRSAHQFFAIYIIKELIAWDGDHRLTSDAQFEEKLENWVQTAKRLKPLKAQILDIYQAKKKFPIRDFEAYRQLGYILQSPDSQTTRLLSLENILSNALIAQTLKLGSGKENDQYDYWLNIVAEEISKCTMMFYQNIFLTALGSSQEEEHSASDQNPQKQAFSSDQKTYFNNLSKYFENFILIAANDRPKLARAVELVLDVIGMLCQVRMGIDVGPNFDGARALHAALQSQRLCRLPWFLELLEEEGNIKKKFMQINALFSYDRNYKAMRSKEAEASSVSIPLPDISLIRKDIEFAQQSGSALEKFEGVGQQLYKFAFTQRLLTYAAVDFKSTLLSEVSRTGDEKKLWTQLYEIKPPIINLDKLKNPFDFDNENNLGLFQEYDLPIRVQYQGKVFIGKKALKKIVAYFNSKINDLFTREKATFLIHHAIDHENQSRSKPINAQRILNLLRAEDANARTLNRRHSQSFSINSLPLLTMFSGSRKNLLEGRQRSESTSLTSDRFKNNDANHDEYNGRKGEKIKRKSGSFGKQ